MDILYLYLHSSPDIPLNIAWAQDNTKGYPVYSNMSNFTYILNTQHMDLLFPNII